MSTATKTASKATTQAATKAAAYYRMSSDDQTDSLDQQRTAVQAYAESHGFEIVAEYHEPGKSGSLRQKERKEWARLLEDSERGKYQAVLAWDLSRLSRADPLKAAADKDRLRSAGVFVQTVREGRIDLDTFSGRLLDYVSQEKNHAYSKDLSRNTIRGREALLARGESPHGAVPYGYRRRYVGPSGEYVAKRDEQFRKPKGWTRTIEVEPAEAEVVKEIYRLYVEMDQSIRAVAGKLTDKGIPSPTGIVWRMNTVGTILANPTYCGNLKTACGPRDRSKRECHNRMAASEITGIFPPIVSEEVWQAAQRRRSTRSTPRTAKRQGGIFSGFLVCGNCGGLMCRHRGTDHRGPFYVCANFLQKPHANKCLSWRAYESDLLYPLISHFVRACDRELIESVKARPVADRPNVDATKRRLKVLAGKIKKARSRYVSCPDDLLPEVEAALKSLVAEQERLSDELRAAETGTDERDQLRKWWEDRRGKLIELRPTHPRFALTEEWPLAEIDSVRGLFRRVGFKVSLWWTSEKRVKYYRHTLDWARMEITVSGIRSRSGGTSTGSRWASGRCG